MKKISKYKLTASVLLGIVLLGSSAAWAAAKRKQSKPKVNKIAEQKQSDKQSGDNKNNGTSEIAASVEQIPTNIQNNITTQNNYPLHKNISTTYFWAGEEAGKDNKNISNLPSAWDDQWAKHFGGVDDPKKRNGFVVATFVPKENSFYFALPYNDFDNNGNRKKNVATLIPWAKNQKWGAEQSMLKNQWIKITKGNKTAYAQWEDVGPFGEDDSAYVFGKAAPKSKTNEDAGLDVSPAVKDFLKLSDVDKTDWQFVDVSQVPDGPWKKTITTSQIFWQ